MRDDALWLLQAPGRFKLGSVTPSGDCFYDCIHAAAALTMRHPVLADAGAMRDVVAESINGEIFDLYHMYAAAGVDDCVDEWPPRAKNARRPPRVRAGSEGHDSGAGQCLWADDFRLDDRMPRQHRGPHHRRAGAGERSRSGRKRQRGGDDEAVQIRAS